MSEPSAGTIELVDASGPVGPRFSFRTRIVIEAAGDSVRATREHRDANGAATDERTLTRTEWEALVARIVAIVPLGSTLDLAHGKTDRKGVAVNEARLRVGKEEARLVYLSSQIDEDDGDHRARAIVEAIRRAAGGSPAPHD